MFAVGGCLDMVTVEGLIRAFAVAAFLQCGASNLHVYTPSRVAHVCFVML